LGDILNIVRY